MKHGQILMLIEDEALARFISEAIHRLSSHTPVLQISATYDGRGLIQKERVLALIVAGTFTPTEIELVRDFQTALPHAPVLLLAEKVATCAPLVSGLPLVQALPIPVPERDLQPTLVNLLYPQGIHVNSRVEAYLSGLFLADIIQLMCASRISAHFVVSTPASGTVGELEFRNGSIVAARYGAFTGPRAVLSLLDIRDGKVIQCAPRPHVEQNVFVPTDRLLIQAASAIDEHLNEHPEGARSETLESEISLVAFEQAFRDTPKLLVVEDNEFLLSYLERILSEAFGEMVVIGVPKGVDGLACAKISPPQVIILDRHLGDMDGKEFCRKLWDMPETLATPVLLISGDLPSETERRNYYAGPICFLEKPFLAASLIQKVADMLGISLDTPDGAESPVAMHHAATV